VSSARRLARLLSIVSTVVQDPGESPRELAASAGISERTLYRDLNELRRLGFEVTYSDGYQLQERLALESGGGPSLGPLPAVYEQQRRLLRSQIPARLAELVQADVEAGAPAALASLFATAIRRRLAAERRSKG
jgi:biotin operon repressor